MLSSNRSDEGLTLEHQLFYPLRWLIYVFNPVVNTKLPANVMLDVSNTYRAICWVDSVKCASIGGVHKLSINKQLMRHLYGHVVHIHVNLNKKIEINTLNPDEANKKTYS